MKNFQLISGSAEETRKIAAALAPLFREGDLIALDGELGAGKTQFVKGFADARGCKDDVTSPTFSIANFYRSPTGDLLHADLYRLETPAEYEELGLEDYFPKVVALVEWGLKFPGYLEPSLLVSFTRERGSDRRVLRFSCASAALAVAVEKSLSTAFSFSPC